MSEQKTIHLVCHAHLDPVWLWPWEDALAEALATFRSACEFCEREPGFIFCHNESLLYEWIEEHDPALFERIRGHVRAGRWHIAGGSFVQPDVNLPAGESHIRQFLKGKAYFRTKFGVEPTTAYNFDSFGHPEGYAQILAGCGFDSYIFCRPSPPFFRPELNSFRWQDRSGAEVLARRVAESYPTNRKAIEKLEKWTPHYAQEPVGLFLWGVGNHGGGPSREDLAHIRNYARAHPELNLVHSTPERFFRDLRRLARDLPVHVGEMQNIFPGCYTSLSRVKRAHRACENLLAVTERMAAVAWWSGRGPYPRAALDAAWRDLLFGEFHDILPGSCIPAAEQDALNLFGHATETLRRAKARVFLSLLRGERRPAPGATPIFIWNPHSFPVQTDAVFEFHPAHTPNPYGTVQLRVRDGRTGRAMRFQTETTSAALVHDIRMRAVAPVRLKPFEMRRIEMTYTRRAQPRPWQMPPLKPHLRFRSRHYSVAINPTTGLIDFAAPRGAGSSFLAPGALQPVIFRDLPNAWGCGDPKSHAVAVRENLGMRPWKDPLAYFALARGRRLRRIVSPASDRWHEAVARRPIEPVRVVEHGPVRTIIEAIFVAADSVVIRRYILSVNQPWLEVHDRIFWNEKDCMLKVAAPLRFRKPTTVSETPYSAVRRRAPDRHVDYFNQRWVAAEDSDGRCIAVLNDGSYAHSLWQNTLYLNVLRSPVHSAMGMRPTLDAFEFRYWPHQDQGEHEVRFRLMFADRFDEIAVSRAAETLNVPPDWQVFFPDGSAAPAGAGSLRRPFIQVAPANVQLCALKQSEDGRGLVIRLREMSGRTAQARLTVAGAARPFQVRLKPHALSTLKVQVRGGRARVEETDLLER